MKMSWNMFSYRWHKGLLSTNDVLMAYCPRCLTAGSLGLRQGKPYYIPGCTHEGAVPCIIIKSDMNMVGTPSEIQRVVDLNAQGGE